MRSTAAGLLALCLCSCPKCDEPVSQLTPIPGLPRPPDAGVHATDAVVAKAAAVDAGHPLELPSDSGSADVDLPIDPLPVRPPDAGWMADAGTSSEDAVKLFEASCSTTFAATFDDMGQKGSASECWARDFVQNCVVDGFGCWDSLEACRDHCSPVCDSCQSGCANACDGCKQKCSGRPSSCITACANERQACRLSCVEKLMPCRATCAAAEQRCLEKGSAKLLRECPDCAAITKCLGTGGDNGCREKFPNAKESCFRDCYVE